MMDIYPSKCALTHFNYLMVGIYSFRMDEFRNLASPVSPATSVSSPGNSGHKLIVIIIVVLLAGIGSGFLLSRLSKSASSGSTSATTTTPAIVNTATEVGSTDTKTFGDTATGTLQAGGLKGEGTHNLVRDGGPSQTVYLVSSVVDLDQYVGKKVQVWGQTLKAAHVSWLMDVGRLKILQ